jgi:hypothetical protein
MIKTNGLPMWVIYENPTDFPGETIARLWQNDVATQQTIQGASLDQLRKRFISMGFVSIGRFEQDDPKIVEVWI